MERLSAFLKTTTGLITALATLIAAVLGLVTAFTQLDGSGDRSEPERVTTVVEGDTIAERQLRAYIPAEVRPTCGPPKDPEENNVAAFNCTYREIVNVQYNLFASDADLRQGEANVRRRYGDKHECGTEPLLCFVGADGVASIIWVDEDADILAFTWRDDGNLDALYETWPMVKN
jgi:hypothetical protein